MTSELESGAPTESFLRVLDQFAELRSYAGEAPAIGGYRLLSPHLKRRAVRAPSAAAIAALARARMRLTGFLSVLFVGGLGLAVLAGPANCPCSNAFTVAEHNTSLARLGYVENARMLTTREIEAELPVLSAATLIEPEASAPGVSPITTSALEPPRQTLAAEGIEGDDLAVSGPGRLPPRTEALADSAPAPVRLAAAPSVESDVPPTLPVVEVATPPRMDITAREANTNEVSRPAVRKRAARAYRHPARAMKKKKVDPTAPTPPPKWAQQMFNNPWQSQAFSYTR